MKFKKYKKMKNKLPKYKTWDNAQLFPKVYAKVDPVSMTVPNEAISLREIVERFSREYPSHLLRTGYYDFEEGEINEESFDDLDETRSSDFDLSEAMELKEKINKKIEAKKVQNTFKKHKNADDELKNMTSEQAENQFNKNDV